MKLLIGNQNYSSWSMRPWIFVAYHELDIEIEKIALFTESAKQTLDQHFSNGKVPLLVDGALEVWDTMAILEYLAEKFPQTNGWPWDPAARAVARAVSAEMHSSFSALRSELPMNCRKFFPGYKLSESGTADVARIEQIWKTCRDNYGQAGPWLFGDFSIADAMYAPVVMRFRSMELDLGDTSRAYFDTMHACPAVQRWLAEGRVEPEIVEEDELDWPSRHIEEP